MIATAAADASTRSRRREGSLAGSGAAGGCPGEGIPAVPDHRHEDGTMTTAIAFPGNTASTFLTHFFGSGLADERYVVERFKALAWIPTLRQGARPMCSSGPRDLRLDHLVWLGFRIVQPQPIIPVQQRDFDRVVVVSIAEKTRRSHCKRGASIPGSSRANGR